MFEHLKKYSTILVTGPQRSGTRICAKMIAKDTGYAYIDELQIHIDSLYALMSLLENGGGMVVQCPSLSRYIHLIGRNKDTAVVWMVRDLEDILASERRIGWAGEEIERMRYDRANGNLVSAQIKTDFWLRVQKQLIPNAFEIEYEDLKAHRLWIDKEDRLDFRSNQTKPDVQKST